MIRWSSLVLVVVVSVVLVGSCRARTPHQKPAPTPDSPPVSSVERAQPSKPKRVLPPLDQEPLLDVLLKRADQVTVRVLRPGSGGGRTWGVGDQRFQAEPAAGESAPFVLSFADGTGPTFALGDQQYGGDLVVKQVKDRLIVCERIPLEQFLLGVLTAEVQPSWPLESLKAQSVAARSYTWSRWAERFQKPWHIVAGERVDLAYDGYVAEPSKRLSVAVAQTRGDVLMYQGLPLKAWFYSCSGGVTADKSAIWPDRNLADGVTDPAPAFSVTRDPWAEVGAKGLGMAKAWEWQFSLPLDKVSWRLRSKAKDAGSPLAIGPNLTDIRVVERGPSGRAQTVEVVSTDGIDRVAANSFRLWVGSHQIRSTLWTSAAVRQGTLVIQGRGFGHGVGLSQVSAWAMAKDSRLAPEILRFFYPGARLLRRW